jgi:hypothetical protein
MSNLCPFLAAHLTPIPTLGPRTDLEKEGSGRVLTAIELAVIFDCLDQPLGLKLNDNGMAAMDSIDEDHTLIKGLEALKPGLIHELMHMNIDDHGQSHESQVTGAGRAPAADTHSYKKNRRSRSDRAAAKDGMDPAFIPLGCTFAQHASEDLPRDVFAHFVARFETASTPDEQIKSAALLVSEISKLRAAGTLSLIPSDLLKTGLGVLEACANRSAGPMPVGGDRAEGGSGGSGAGEAEREHEGLEASARAAQARALPSRRDTLPP